MEHTKKLILVDPRMVENQPPYRPSFRRPTDIPQPPTNITQPETVVIDTTLRSLEEGLRKLLNTPHMSEEEKARLHMHYLQQYIAMKAKQTDTYRDAYLAPPPPPPPPTPAEAAPEDGTPAAPAAPIKDPKIAVEIMATVPKSLKKQAGVLLARLKEDPNVGWNSKGELTIEGETVPKSNMVDLVNDLLRKRKDFNPRGWQALAAQLYKTNVPQDLIRNPERWEFISSLGGGGATAGPALHLSPTVEKAIQELEVKAAKGTGKGPAKRGRSKTKSTPKAKGSRRHSTPRHRVNPLARDTIWEHY